MSSQEQPNSTHTPKRIKQRKITHGAIKNLSSNKNGPKFILGHCLINYRDRIVEECLPQALPHIKSAFMVIENWISKGQRDKLTMRHLKQLFGRGDSQQSQLRRYYISRVFYSFLSENLLQLLWSNKKVQKMLSYMICLQKFTSRLPNPQLIYKLQFK